MQASTRDSTSCRSCRYGRKADARCSDGQSWPGISGRPPQAPDRVPMLGHMLSRRSSVTFKDFRSVAGAEPFDITLGNRGTEIFIASGFLLGIRQRPPTSITSSRGLGIQWTRATTSCLRITGATARNATGFRPAIIWPRGRNGTRSSGQRLQPNWSGAVLSPNWRPRTA
jgi:hypothetical protein